MGFAVWLAKQSDGLVCLSDDDVLDGVFSYKKVSVSEGQTDGQKDGLSK